MGVSVSAEIIRLFLEIVVSMDKMPSEVLARIHVSVVGEQPFAANSFEFVWTGGNAAISLCRINYMRWFDQWCIDFRLLTDTFAHWWLHPKWKQDVSNGFVELVLSTVHEQDKLWLSWMSVILKLLANKKNKKTR